MKTRSVIYFCIILIALIIFSSSCATLINSIKYVNHRESFNELRSWSSEKQEIAKKMDIYPKAPSISTLALSIATDLCLITFPVVGILEDTSMSISDLFLQGTYLALAGDIGLSIYGLFQPIYNVNYINKRIDEYLSAKKNYKPGDSPLKILETTFDYHDGILRIIIINISDKNVKAFGVKAEFYNDFGEIVPVGVDLFVAQQIYFKPCYKRTFSWEIYGSTATEIGDIEITEVVFSDGTKWKAEQNK